MPGDKVWVKDTENYNEIVTVSTVGTNALPIVFEILKSTEGLYGSMPSLNSKNNYIIKI